MPRASWRGFLRLSLVSCPIYLSPATTRTKPIRLHQVWQPAPDDVDEDDLPDRGGGQRASVSSVPRLLADNASPDGDQSPAATRITLRPHDPGTGEEIEKREESRPIPHLHRRGAEGARCRKLKDCRSGEIRAGRRHRSGLFREP